MTTATTDANGIVEIDPCQSAFVQSGDRLVEFVAEQFDPNQPPIFTGLRFYEVDEDGNQSPLADTEVEFTLTVQEAS